MPQPAVKMRKCEATLFRKLFLLCTSLSVVASFLSNGCEGFLVCKLSALNNRISFFRPGVRNLRLSRCVQFGRTSNPARAFCLPYLRGVGATERAQTFAIPRIKYLTPKALGTQMKRLHQQARYHHYSPPHTRHRVSLRMSPLDDATSTEESAPPPISFSTNGQLLLFGVEATPEVDRIATITCIQFNTESPLPIPQIDSP